MPLTMVQVSDLLRAPRNNSSTGDTPKSWHYTTETYTNHKGDELVRLVKTPGLPSKSQKIPQTVQLGTFVGRVGSTVRSRNGRTHRAPNGSRKYVNDATIPLTVAYRA